MLFSQQSLSKGSDIPDGRHYTMAVCMNLLKILQGNLEGILAVTIQTVQMHGEPHTLPMLSAQFRSPRRRNDHHFEVWLCTPPFPMHLTRAHIRKRRTWFAGSLAHLCQRDSTGHLAFQLFSFRTDLRDLSALQRPASPCYFQPLHSFARKQRRVEKTRPEFSLKAHVSTEKTDNTQRETASLRLAVPP